MIQTPWIVTIHSQFPFHVHLILYFILDYSYITYIVLKFSERRPQPWIRMEVSGPGGRGLGAMGLAALMLSLKPSHGCASEYVC